MTTITEADVEQAALAWLSGLGWQMPHGPDILGAGRDDYGQVVLESRLPGHAVAAAGVEGNAGDRRIGTEGTVA